MLFLSVEFDVGSPFFFLVRLGGLAAGKFVSILEAAAAAALAATVEFAVAPLGFLFLVCGTGGCWRFGAFLLSRVEAGVARAAEIGGSGCVSGTDVVAAFSASCLAFFDLGLGAGFGVVFAPLLLAAGCFRVLVVLGFGSTDEAVVLVDFLDSGVVDFCEVVGDFCGVDFEDDWPLVAGGGGGCGWGDKSGFCC